MLGVVPCTSKKTMRTESQKDIEEILNTKLATIMEEPEFCEENVTPPPRHWRAIKARRSIQAKIKMVRLFLPQFNLRESSGLFVTGFASKGSFGGLLQY